MTTRKRRVWLDLVLAAALLSAVVACTWQGIKPDDTSSRQLLISGKAPHVSDQHIAAIAAPYLEASFFSVDLKRLREKLDSQPWLKNVAVSRHWPDGVTVHVAEHKPVARWNRASLLAADGAVFTPARMPETNGLVKLAGPEAQGADVYATYRELAATLAHHKAEMAALKLNARGAWVATLDSGLRLRLGRQHMTSRMRRFVDFALGRPRARHAISKAGYVDLRYSDGFAVGGQRASRKSDSDQEKDNEQAA